MNLSQPMVFSSDDLKNRLKSLNATSIEHDFSKPQTNNLFAETREAFSQYQSDVLDINLEEWYDLIPHYTFATIFMELSPADAEWFVSNFLHADAKSGVSFQDDNIFNMENRLSSSFNDMLSASHSLVPHENPNFFVKTSCRSPKDSLAMTSRIDERFQDILRSVDIPIRNLSENDLMIYLLQAAKHSMCVSAAREALDLLLTSRRIYQDFTLALSHPDRWKQNLCIRQWIPIEVDMEFRCFVSKGRLTAISQYHHLCFFQRLVDSKYQLLLLISTFFNEHLKTALGVKFQDYIIDIGILMQDGLLEAAKAIVIELNPFLETTDACCFNWKHDIEILTGAQQSSRKVPIPFRIRERALKGSRAMIYDSWRAILETKLRDVSSDEQVIH